MLTRVWLAVSTAFLCVLNVHAVERNGTFDSTAPTSTDIANWDTGWGESGITGWDYVGKIAGTSGVYLGNGWVLTAAHVGPGTFILPNGPAAGTYTPTGVGYTFSNSDGPVDLRLYQVNTTPALLALPALTLAGAPPASFLSNPPGDGVAMIGYGGTGNETWGFDTVTLTNQEIEVPNGMITYFSDDFITANASVSNGVTTHTNNSQLVSGDSGGGDFIFTGGQWELAGINEAIGSGTVGDVGGTWFLGDNAAEFPPGSTNVQNINLSAMVQVSEYAAGIDLITGVPEPPAWSLLLIALGMTFGFDRFRRSFRMCR